MKSTPVTLSFILLCLIVSVPGIFSPAYFETFSGELPHEYWWQKFTMVFQHGAVNQPVAIMLHLALNCFLLVACGRLVEPMLGSTKFLILSLIAWGGFIATQYFSGIWINGSSGVIWAYSPFLLRVTNTAGDFDTEQRTQATVLLVLMWAVITIAMGFVPLLFNPTHSLLHTFFYGNLFHASATMVGFIFHLRWRN